MTALNNLKELASGSAAALLLDCRRLYAPPPRFKVSEFCDAKLVVTSGPESGTRWRTDAYPYQRGILDAFHEPGVETVVVMSSAQVGKTSVAVSLVAYHIVHDPCSILVVQPTVDPMAKDFSKNRLDPLIRAVPELEQRVDKRRSKDASNTTLLKTYTGGLLAVAGANSGSSLRARPIRFLILDEVDGYPREIKGEGSTISIARNRTKAYGRRKREFISSTPTERGAPIDDFHGQGDQRRYYIPCPACGAMHPLEWKNVRWDPGKPAAARFHCPECEQPMSEADRKAALAHGEWVAENPDREDTSIVSFHIWEAYSPTAQLPKMVRTFLRARRLQKAGDPSEMQAFINGTLGEPVEPDDGEGVEPNVVTDRAEPYAAPAPAGVVFITAGIDVQDDRIEVLVLGWGRGGECWIIDWKVIRGDTEQQFPWDQLDELLAHEYRHESGARMQISASAIDSAGHRTNIVYEYARRQAARRVHAIIGRAGERAFVSKPAPKQRGRGGRKVPLYTIGVDTGKEALQSRLQVTEPGPGYIHVPKGAPWANDELAAQLTAERRVRRFRNGRNYYRWEKRRARNEALDCWVMGFWTLKLITPDLDLLGLLAERLEEVEPEQPKPSEPEPKKQWIPKSRRRGWLKR